MRVHKKIKKAVAGAMALYMCVAVILGNAPYVYAVADTTSTTEAVSTEATSTSEATETTEPTTETEGEPVVQSDNMDMQGASTGTLIGNNVYLRSGPGRNYSYLTASGAAIKLNAGNAVTVNGTSTGTDTQYPTWYKVTFTYNGGTYSGYVATNFVSVAATGTTNNAVAADANFEAKLSAQGFPESYKTYLRNIHAKYPNWEFTAVKTGLDWNTVVENERCKSGQVKNLIYGANSAPHYNWRSTSVGYNCATDKWSPYDGTVWFAASDDLVKYYLDPRTYLSENYIFCFENLSYVSGMQTQPGVEAILAGSFMGNTYPKGSSSTYSSVMMSAATNSKVSPYFIASRIKQEIGNTASGSVTGTNGSYSGIYNFYNIGANDTAGGGAIEKGLAWASSGSTYLRPWNTPYKSIAGGAMYIGEKYIYKGQNTLYTQKFNVTYTGMLYLHQYMSNIQSPATEANKLYTAYKTSGVISNAMTFAIPVYNNMPATACAKPADSGNPNNWLKTLSVSNNSLTPTFAINEVKDYSLIVPYGTASVSINATAVNSAARVSGAGNISLAVGTNNIPITVTAQSGATRTYNLTIVRKNADGSISSNTNSSTSFSTTYSVAGSQITGVAPSTNAANFVSKLGATGSTVTVYKADGATVQSGAVGTGNVVRVTKGGATTSYTVVLYGDVSGDGAINALDLLKVQKHITGASKLNGAYATAGNIKKSGNINALDLLKLQKHIIGSSKITQ